MSEPEFDDWDDTDPNDPEPECSECQAILMDSGRCWYCDNAWVWKPLEQAHG